MGLFFSARSWRAPLQLIDCWLPEPGSTAPQRVGSGPRAPAPSSVTPGSVAVQRFTRAGWLGRKAANAPRLDDPTDPAGAEGPVCGAGHSERRSGRPASAGARRSGARVVLSGRMDQVCAELDRLAAQEEALQRAA